MKQYVIGSYAIRSPIVSVREGVEVFLLHSRICLGLKKRKTATEVAVYILYISLSGDESFVYGYSPSEVARSHRDPLKSPSMNFLPARTWNQFVGLDRAGDDNTCMQRPPSEVFEVIPLLCQVKRISPRHAQSENGAPLALRRPPRGSRFSINSSSSSAPSRSSARPRVLTNVDGRLERCRQLERTVRDQEKIITLLESELRQTRSHGSRKQTPLRGRIRPSTPMRSESAPPLPCGLGEGSSTPSSTGTSRPHGQSSPHPPLLPPDTSANPSSVPVLAHRVRSLVREIREETESSLLRPREPSQASREQC
ncbi:hypothetical protein TcWFU_009853 [Taenia crassiceps]|uniref:Uncharacterized protein n=1 Tax=Taenia crassiceps TaxID=6207 RepID=A0ABR4Q170_9CEST